MKALIRDRYGLSDVLEIREVERPLPQEDEVLIQVHAASINDWDWGLLQSPTLPFMRVPPKPFAQHVYQPGRGMNLARRAMSA